MGCFSWLNRSYSYSAADGYSQIEKDAVNQFVQRLPMYDFLRACLITDEIATRELRRLVGLLEGKQGLPEVGDVELPMEGRALSLDEFSARYLAPLASELFRKRNPALALPEWV